MAGGFEALAWDECRYGCQRPASRPSDLVQGHCGCQRGASRPKALLDTGNRSTPFRASLGRGRRILGRGGGNPDLICELTSSRLVKTPSTFPGANQSKPLYYHYHVPKWLGQAVVGLKPKCPAVSRWRPRALLPTHRRGWTSAPRVCVC